MRKKVGRKVFSGYSALWLSVALDPSHLLRTRRRLRRYLKASGVEERISRDIVLCVEEACSNAIRHSKAVEEIQLALCFEGDDLIVRVIDRGCGFCADEFDGRALPDLRESGGRGLFIIGQLMDELSLFFKDGLELRMVKRGARRIGVGGG